MGCNERKMLQRSSTERWRGEGMQSDIESRRKRWNDEMRKDDGGTRATDEANHEGEEYLVLSDRKDEGN